MIEFYTPPTPDDVRTRRLEAFDKKVNAWIATDGRIEWRERSRQDMGLDTDIVAEWVNTAGKLWSAAGWSVVFNHADPFLFEVRPR